MRLLVAGALALSLLALAAADPWAALGLQRDADESQIKRAYRTLALKLHPDKNPSPTAQKQWLRVQAAYEELVERGSDPFTRHYREHQAAEAEAAARRAAQQAAWREAQARQREKARAHIASASDELDTNAFRQLVLSREERPDGQPWLIQIYANDSPYCRALSAQWEEAIREFGSLLSFGRINYQEHPMLVRYVASHLRSLFRSSQPWRELPVIFGLPRGCYSMRCAVVFEEQVTSNRLQRFAGARLLRLPALPPLSGVLLGYWCRAVPEGQLGVLAVLREGQPQPLHLLHEARKAKGRVQAAVATWRPADRGLWLSLVGAASPPVLIFCKGPSSARHLVTLKSSSLTDGSVWGAELRRHTSPDLEESTAPHAGLPALAAAHVLMAAMHGVSRVELLARRFAQGLRAITRLVGWHHVLIVAMGLTSLWSFKIILDALSATDDEYAEDGSPLKRPPGGPQQAADGEDDGSSAAGRVGEMQHSDWGPSPGRFLVLLPLPGKGANGSSSSGGNGGGQEAAAAAAAVQRLESLAAVFQKERRLLFRLAPVSEAFQQFFPAAGKAAAGAAAAAAAAAAAGDCQQQQQQQQPQQQTAYVLHPQRGRFQALPLWDTQAAVLRLEGILDGGGSWQGAAS